MNEPARRTDFRISFDGVDITEDLKRYLIDFSYTDNEEGESDDLTINLQDREGIWLTGWLEQSINAAAAGKLKVSGTIIPENWGDGYSPLPMGTFEVDSVECSGPPQTISIKATALPYSASIRSTKKTKAWEAYHLRGIAEEIAQNAGLQCVFESRANPYYERKEQNKKEDILFLQELCRDAGISLKCSDSQLVCFDQSVYEAMEPVLTIRKSSGKDYTGYRLEVSSADTQYSSCEVSYADPGTGKTVKGTATATEGDTESGQTLYITAKAADNGEAKTLAEKWLRMANKFSRTGSIELHGHSCLVAGCTVKLEDFGYFDGKYMISQATHTVTRSGGWKTSIALRRVLSGY